MSPAVRTRITRSAVTLLASLTMACPSLAWAGGDSIASAPMLTYGQLEVGGGKTKEWWRFQAFAGDKLTLRADFTGNNSSISVDVFDPGVDDFRLSQSQPTVRHELGLGDSLMRQITMNIPFSGTGVLGICMINGGNCVGRNPHVRDLTLKAFSFVPSVAHKTAVTVSAPARVRRSSSVRVSARVQSPAGQPLGACDINGREVPLAGAVCASRLKGSSLRARRVRVRFLPDEGWQPSSGAKTVRLRP